MTNLKLGAMCSAAVVLFSTQVLTPPAVPASEPSLSGGTQLALFGWGKARKKGQLKKKEAELARTVLSGLQKEARLVLFSESEGCKECGKVGALLEEIAAMSPLLSLEKLSLAGNPARAAELGIDKVPGIAMLDGEGNGRGIRYYGTPVGYEFPAFLEAVVNTAHGFPGLLPETLAGLEDVKSPVTITVFVTEY